jgi:hypothetical protein
MGKNIKTKTKFKARESANQDLRHHLRGRAVEEEVGMENGENEARSEVVLHLFKASLKVEPLLIDS